MTKSGFAAGQLRSIVERIERLEEEKAALAADIREVYAEAKGNGFDVARIRDVVKLRKLEAADRQEREAVLDLYKSALGMLDGTPLGDATLNRLADEVKPGRRTKALDDAVAALGTPVELTEDERARGMTSAFVDKKGNRMSIGATHRREPAHAE